MLKVILKYRIRRIKIETQKTASGAETSGFYKTKTKNKKEKKKRETKRLGQIRSLDSEIEDQGLNKYHNQGNKPSYAKKQETKGLEYIHLLYEHLLKQCYVPR